jgi:hypothetical protein
MLQIRSSVNLAKSDQLKLFTARTRNIMVNILATRKNCSAPNRKKVLILPVLVLQVRRANGILKNEQKGWLATRWSTQDWKSLQKHFFYFINCIVLSTEDSSVLKRLLAGVYLFLTHMHFALVVCYMLLSMFLLFIMW